MGQQRKESVHDYASSLQRQLDSIEDLTGSNLSTITVAAPTLTAQYLSWQAHHTLEGGLDIHAIWRQRDQNGREKLRMLSCWHEEWMPILRWRKFNSHPHDEIACAAVVDYHWIRRFMTCRHWSWFLQISRELFPQVGFVNGINYAVESQRETMYVCEHFRRIKEIISQHGKPSR